MEHSKRGWDKDSNQTATLQKCFSTKEEHLSLPADLSYFRGLEVCLLINPSLQHCPIPNTLFPRTSPSKPLFFTANEFSYNGSFVRETVSSFQSVEVCLYVSGCTEMCGQGRRFWHLSPLTIEIKRQTMLFFTSWALLNLPILVLDVPVCLHSWNPLTLERSSIIPLFSQWPRKMNASFFQGQRLTLLCSPRERHSCSSFFLILSTLIKQALRCIHSLGKKNKTMKVC